MNPYAAAGIKLLSALLMLTLILYLSASNFDESEIKVIGAFGAFLGAGTFGEALANRK
jgi:hypothetical protein